MLIKKLKSKNYSHEGPVCSDVVCDICLALECLGLEGSDVVIFVFSQRVRTATLHSYQQQIYCTTGNRLTEPAECSV